MLLGASAWKLEGGFDLPLIVTRTDFLFENHELVLHPWVDVALVVLRPEAPERVADYVAEACLPLDPKDITAQLSQNIFPLVELLSLTLRFSGSGRALDMWQTLRLLQHQLPDGALRATSLRRRLEGPCLRGEAVGLLEACAILRALGALDTVGIVSLELLQVDVVMPI